MAAYPEENEIRTIEQLDDFINYLTNNKVTNMSDRIYPSISPKIQKIYNLYIQATQAQNIEQALVLYNSVLRLAPNFVAARYNMASLVKQTGNLDEALRQLILAARYNPKDPSIFIEIGTTYSSLGRKKEEIESYLHVLHITSPNDLSGSNLSVRWAAMLNLGTTYREIQQYQKSLEWLEKALSWAKKYNELSSFEHAWDKELVITYRELGNSYQAVGEISKSEEMYLIAMNISGTAKVG